MPGTTPTKWLESRTSRDHIPKYLAGRSGQCLSRPLRPQQGSMLALFEITGARGGRLTQCTARAGRRCRPAAAVHAPAGVDWTAGAARGPSFARPRRPRTPPSLSGVIRVAASRASSIGGALRSAPPRLRPSNAGVGVGGVIRRLGGQRADSRYPSFAVACIPPIGAASCPRNRAGCGPPRGGRGGAWDGDDRAFSAHR